MSHVAVRLADTELETLRQAVIEVVLAPAADIAASQPADTKAAEEVRVASGLLSRIGWPGEAAAAEVPARDVPDARRAMLLLISGALEGAWEAATFALDDPDDHRDELHDALSRVESAGMVLRRLDIEGDREAGARHTAGAPARRVDHAARNAGLTRYNVALQHVVG